NGIHCEFWATVVANLEQSMTTMVHKRELQNNVLKFEAVCGFPSVVDALDGCHLAVVALTTTGDALPAPRVVARVVQAVVHRGLGLSEQWRRSQRAKSSECRTLRRQNLTLVDRYEARRTAIDAKGDGPHGSASKQRAWLQITKDLYTVSNVRRDVADVKKKWADYKSIHKKRGKTSFELSYS
ncbi:hypothetical protein HPB47_014746, partial [Ixodes persulcatus]